MCHHVRHRVGHRVGHRVRHRVRYLVRYHGACGHELTTDLCQRKPRRFAKKTRRFATKETRRFATKKRVVPQPKSASILDANDDQRTHQSRRFSRF